jgi:methylthioribulose-1-phosphate dehydratase
MAEIVTLIPAGEDEELRRLERAVAAVIEAGRKAAARGWVPATSGNFSARIDENTIAITRSGTDKGALSRADILVVDLDAPDPRASAEAPLHYALYRDFPAIGAINHVHSPAASVLSRSLAEGTLRLEGWELQKAFAGIRSHETAVDVPVFLNDQDTARLSGAASRRLAEAGNSKPAPGYLIAGHGLYTWGSSPEEAWRHTEALETLLAYQLSYERLRA